MRKWVIALLSFLQLFTNASFGETKEVPVPGKKVYIVPVQEDIMPPLVYLIRRGVKEAMEAKADLLVLDMDTNGGRVDTTEEIIEIINQFDRQTATYVNKKAFSAGAFISFATQKIYMAPQSVIGAAAPILMSPTGGAEGMNDTLEAKMTSAISALVRANAEKNGHNVEVADAMVKKTKELVIDGKVLNEKGQILTLTDKEAAKEYGDPPNPLLSAGTVESMEALLEELGFGSAQVIRIEPTGAEKLGFWLNAISPLLLLIGIVGVYLEFKTPGFGLPGVVGLVAFTLYFTGAYIAALSGAEWILVFILGLVLIAMELFLFPGTIALGVSGAAMVLAAIIMAVVDVYPGAPALPDVSKLKRPLQELAIAIGGAVALILLLARLLPKTPVYGALISQTASGVRTESQVEQKRAAQLGQTGVTISTLRPGGKAQFGDAILDVMSQGELIAKGQRVKIIGFSGPDAIVEPQDEAA